jgi:hypothetical protein
MDRIKSQNCGSRAWSKVILGQAQETVRRGRMLRFAEKDISY